MNYHNWCSGLIDKKKSRRRVPFSFPAIQFLLATSSVCFFFQRHRPRCLFCRRPVTSGTLNRAGKHRRRSNTSLYRRLFVSGPSPAWDTPPGRRVIYVYSARVRPSAVTRIPRAVVLGNGRGSRGSVCVCGGGSADLMCTRSAIRPCAGNESLFKRPVHAIYGENPW